MEGISMFTKEYWHCLGEDAECGEIPIIVIEAGECGTPTCRPVAHVQCTITDDDEFILTQEDWDNARLINAAPKLLKALEEIEAGCVGYQPGHVAYEENRTKPQIQEIAKAAIAEALTTRMEAEDWDS